MGGDGSNDTKFQLHEINSEDPLCLQLTILYYVLKLFFNDDRSCLEFFQHT